MPLSHGYTHEEQITDEARQSGIQIDVYPLLASAVQFRDENGNSIDIGVSPAELEIPEGGRISMHLMLRFFNSSLDTSLMKIWTTVLFFRLNPCVVLEDYVKRVDPKPVIKVTCRRMHLSCSCSPT